MFRKPCDLFSNPNFRKRLLKRIEEGWTFKKIEPMSTGEIFDWLNLQDMNVLIILILMLVVAGFNMVSGLLILILDRTNMIGILKALGSPNASIRKIFLYQSGFMILRGLLWGNVIGLGICLIQHYFGFIELDQSSYYLNTVPINFNLLHILALNFGTAGIILLMLIIPSMVISRISPARAIRFE